MRTVFIRVPVSDLAAQCRKDKNCDKEVDTVFHLRYGLPAKAVFQTGTGDK
jgi:hypothetical protein